MSSTSRTTSTPRRLRGNTCTAAAAPTQWNRPIPCSSGTIRSMRRTSPSGSTRKTRPITEVKRFDWFRGYQVGGRSLTWGRQSYRWSDFDFEANAQGGYRSRLAHSLRRTCAVVRPRGEACGISGSRDGLPQLPDGQFLPPMPLNCGEELVAGRLKHAFGGKRRMIIGRTANATKPLEGRAPCQYRNACWLGCPYGGYFSTQSSTLPAAVKTGNLTLKPWSIVTEVLYRQESQARHRRAGAGRRHRADDRLLRRK